MYINTVHLSVMEIGVVTALRFLKLLHTDHSELHATWALAIALVTAKNTRSFGMLDQNEL